VLLLSFQYNRWKGCFGLSKEFGLFARMHNIGKVWCSIAERVHWLLLKQFGVCSAIPEILLRRHKWRILFHFDFGLFEPMLFYVGSESTGNLLFVVLKVKLWEVFTQLDLRLLLCYLQRFEQCPIEFLHIPLQQSALFAANTSFRGPSSSHRTAFGCTCHPNLPGTP
jgi:hypothetical protein